MTVRMLVTGWRKADPHNEGHRAAVRKALIVGAKVAGVYRDLALDQVNRELVLVHGACEGVDYIAELVGRHYGWNIERHPAQKHPSQNFGPWPGCGPLRNLYMIDQGADIVVAMPGPGSKGTHQCLRAAILAGLRTLVIPIEP